MARPNGVSQWQMAVGEQLDHIIRHLHATMEQNEAILEQNELILKALKVDAPQIEAITKKLKASQEALNNAVKAAGTVAGS